MPNNTPISDLLDSLRSISDAYPKATIDALLARRAESVPALLNIFRNQTELYKDVAMRDEQLPFFAMYTLAQLRETALCPLLLETLRYPFEDDSDLDAFWGDILFEDVPSILLSVYDGNATALTELALNKNTLLSIRFVALQTMGLLYAHGKIDQETFYAVMRKSYSMEKTSKEEFNFVLIGFCGLVIDLQLQDFAEEAKVLIRNQMKDLAKLSELTDALKKDSKAARTQFLEINQHQEISSVEESTNWWVSQILAPEESEEAESAPVANSVASKTPGQGRNDLCACGSGRKFKKCCGE